MNPSPLTRACRSLPVLAVAATALGLAALSVGVADAQGAPVAGTAVIGTPPAGSPELTSGGSGTPFMLSAPGAACSGDSASGGYQVNTYFVPASIDPATLTYDSNGPIAPSGLALPLFQAVGGSPVVGVLTDITTGLVLNIPEVSFAALAEDPSLAPPGEYNVGFACWRTTSPAFLDKYWNVRMTLTADPADTPVGFTWAVEASSGSTTTTTTSGTTTTVAGATTTTSPVGGTTTTTAAGATTSTSLASSGATTTTFRVATTVRFGSGAGSGSGGGSSIPTTGSSTLNLVIWASLLLVVGRMVILAARRVQVVEVRPDDRRR